MLDFYCVGLFFEFMVELEFFRWEVGCVVGIFVEYSFRYFLILWIFGYVYYLYGLFRERFIVMWKGLG